MERFFIPTAPVTDALTLEGQEAEHLRVRRLKKGDGVTLFDGSGWEYTGKISSLARREVHIQILGREQVSRELPVPVTLGQAMPKNQAWHTILQKATELGVAGILPLISRYIATENWRGKAARWQKIVIEACKQCGRNRIPSIAAAVDWEQMLQQTRTYPLKLIAHLDPAAPSLKSILASSPRPDRLLILIGPEGGWSAAEIASAQDHQFRCFSLGPRILRADTAALAVLAGVAFYWEA